MNIHYICLISDYCERITVPINKYLNKQMNCNRSIMHISVLQIKVKQALLVKDKPPNKTSAFTHLLFSEQDYDYDLIKMWI